MLEQFNQYVYHFWIFFATINVALIGFCIWCDGFVEFIKGDSKEVITIIVGFALFCEILFELGRRTI